MDHGYRIEGNINGRLLLGMAAQVTMVSNDVDFDGARIYPIPISPLTSTSRPFEERNPTERSCDCG